MPRNALVLPILLYLCRVTCSLSLSGNGISDVPQTCPKDGITNCYNNQGFGSQFNGLAAALRMATEQKKTFCPSGFAKNGIHALLTEKAWEFIGGSAYGPAANSDTPCQNQGKEEFGCSSINGQSVGYNRLVREQIYDHYMSAMKPELSLLKAKTTNIAWHIRRGDRAKTAGQGIFYGYELNNTDVAASMGSLMTLLKGKNTQKNLVFFSEGKEEDFEDVKSKCKQLGVPCSFQLDSSKWESAFHHFVMADIFVSASISNFSRAAAYLREASKKTTYDSFDLLTRSMSEMKRTEMGWAKIMKSHFSNAKEKPLDLQKMTLETKQRRYNCTSIHD